MSILIKGMEMPTDGMIGVFISSDGNVYNSMDDIIGTIVPVPPHGDLIEREMVHELVNWTRFKPPFCRKQVRRFIDDAPTIIEAEVDDDSK